MPALPFASYPWVSFPSLHKEANPREPPEPSLALLASQAKNFSKPSCRDQWAAAAPWRRRRAARSAS